ncbi:MAG: CheR family methyltransferase [Gemmataceae bacterium]
MNPVAAVLERRLGLNPGAVGGRALEVAVGRRLAAAGIADVATYADRVQADRREFDALVEAVVVPETWFLRYPESFRHLAGWAAERRRALPVGRPLRVLCVPCSTGEEAYSVALTLLDAGLPAGSFRVDGVDVSGRAVAAAEAGCIPTRRSGTPTGWPCGRGTSPGRPTGGRSGTRCGPASGSGRAT